MEKIKQGKFYINYTHDKKGHPCYVIYKYKNRKSYIVKITHNAKKAYKLLRNVDPNDIRPEYIRKKLFEVNCPSDFGKRLDDLYMSKENKPIIEMIKRHKKKKHTSIK